MIQRCAQPVETAPIGFVSLLQQGKDLLQMRQGVFLTLQLHKFCCVVAEKGVD